MGISINSELIAGVLSTQTSRVKAIFKRYPHFLVKKWKALGFYWYFLRKHSIRQKLEKMITEIFPF